MPAERSKNMRIIPKQGVCDPHVHVFEGKAYMYTSHDRAPGLPIYRMDDWQIFSSDDLLNWKLEAVVHPEDTFLGKCEECYATDAAERNGKYYFYFSHQQYCTGVAVSENGPAGPFKDALGKPLLPKGMVPTFCYDPCVFIDDDEDKTPYIIFGITTFGRQYYIARLNEDMISLAEEPKPVELINGWERDAAQITKRGGVYYLNTHRGLYATADNIYGPYTYRGKFCNDAYVDHGTFFTYHNQTYLTYGVPENYHEDEKEDIFYRTTKMIYAHYTDNGDIVTDPFIEDAGVGQYDANWDYIKGEWFFAASDGIFKKENDDGFELRGIKNNSYICFKNVNNMRQNAQIFLRASNGNKKPCIIEIREDSPFGTVLGCCKINSTTVPTSFKEVACRLENTHGTHNLCFVFKGEDEEVCRFEDFRFEHIKP